MEPATGETLAEVGIASAEDVDRSARQALKAQAAWAETPFDQRAAVLREAARLLQGQVETFHYWNQLVAANTHWHGWCDSAVELPSTFVNALGRPALAMGNAVIFKPDQQSAVTGGLLIAKVPARGFVACVARGPEHGRSGG